MREAERDRQAQRDNLKQLRVAALKAIEERHKDERDALDAEFNERFNVLNGRPTKVTK